MIGVIADDLTGAAEIGAIGLRHGLTAEVVFGSEFPCDAELVCADTESRSLPAREAAQRVAVAARRLRRAGAKLIFKKTDSVLRGQVIAELEAMMEVLKFTRALLLPANPTLGRTIHNKKYSLKGRPINRTDFARDPEHPRRSANVLKMLGDSERFPVRVLRRHETLSTTGIFVGEVASTLHIREWIARCEADTMLAGGAETFTNFLRSRRPEAETYANTSRACRSAHVGGHSLFVCGSASDSCRKFIARAKRLGIPVVTLPSELGRGDEFSSAANIAQRVIEMLETELQIVLAIGLPQIVKRDIARRLTGYLAQVAARVIDGGNVDHVLAEGGETAASLVRPMNWARLSVKYELAPGVATLEAGGGVLFTVKPGSYTWPANILRERHGQKFVARRSGQRKRKSAK